MSSEWGGPNSHDMPGETLEPAPTMGQPVRAADDTPGGEAVRVAMRFCLPPPALAPFFTSFYLAEIDVADGATGQGQVSDFLHPEWGNLRFHDRPLVEAASANGNHIAGTRFSATGPSSHALRFTVGPCRIWGAGLLPMGWARFVPSPAAAYADAVVDGHVEPAFAPFRSLAATLFGPEPDPEAELARITAHFTAMLPGARVDDQRIMAVHSALVEPSLHSVTDLVARVGVSARSVERVCQQAFGFSPKILLRRQRFARSLAHYMLDPSMKWIDALDGHYHDQAQFVREFRAFMGMTPSQYGAIPHPILDAFVRERARIAGAPMQALVLPKVIPRPAHCPDGD